MYDRIYSPAVLTDNAALQLDSVLFKDRIIYLTGEIDETKCSFACEQLLYLNSLDTKKPIHLYISGPGGDGEACKMVLNTMDHIKAPVYTYALGMVASADAIIFTHGDKRFITPTTCVMYHQCLSGNQGEIQNISVRTNFTKRFNNIMMSIVMHDCGYIDNEEYQEIIKTFALMDDKDEYPTLKINQDLLLKLKKFKSLIDRDTFLVGQAVINFGGADCFISQTFKTARKMKKL